MRRFHSYGPVNEKHHFTVKRRDLVRTCFNSLVGDADEGGHFFTIWGARQTGKTWLMRQVIKEIENRYGDRFIIGNMSMQGVILANDAHEDEILEYIPDLFWKAFDLEIEMTSSNWKNFTNLFDLKKGVFDRPVILFIDEFDSLPSQVIDRMVSLFRDMYLTRENYLLHGLALIGVRAVLGLDSLRGSPFNIQRSLQVPNFTEKEVADLFDQYKTESGRTVAPEVPKAVFESVQGQPGLVCWFGELLTEKYPPGAGKPITLPDWEYTLEAAFRIEWNNTLLNLIKKARGPYLEYVMQLFASSDMPFNVRDDGCAFLYLNGVITHQEITDSKGRKTFVCRFASPFIQSCLYDTLTEDLTQSDYSVPPLDFLDDLADVFETGELDLPALMERYKAYLSRLKAKGINPWKDQPWRADMHLTEATGHFHL